MEDFFLWKGNVMKENCHYRIRKNCLPFHSIPCSVPSKASVFVQAIMEFDDKFGGELAGEYFWFKYAEGC